MRKRVDVVGTVPAAAQLLVRVLVAHAAAVTLLVERWLSAAAAVLSSLLKNAP